ncbi:putative 3-methyladenine DNA glycosylase [Prorops nasuta]|uniref:putative 3-methyladenine DNA glycosylase n=1 Tax=Prorops nasuta TaxID=863751 RepID=UPI0034CDE719
MKKRKLISSTSEPAVDKKKFLTDDSYHNDDKCDETVLVKSGKKINLDILKNYKDSVKEELETHANKVKKRTIANRNKLLKEELKPLEDPPCTSWEKEISAHRLDHSFFHSPCEELATKLLGKVLVRKLDNGAILKGLIVETESYLGGLDKASQSYQNKVTPRNVPMYMPPGTIYIYMTYGMYHCFNLSSLGEGSAVLIRALEPLEGIEYMVINRKAKSRSKNAKTINKTLEIDQLCNGPSKLCMAFQLEKCHSKYSICTWKNLWLENSLAEESITVVSCPRIGIDSAGIEWASKHLRYYIYNNKFVSKRDKKIESLIQSSLNKERL